MAPVPRWVPQRQIAVPASLPVPMGGINASASLAAMAPTDAVYAYNIHSSNMGVRVRDGWQEWVNPSSAIGAVRTIIPYGGNLSSGTDAKLFVATPAGIYDVTSTGTTATQMVAFGTNSGRAGWGSFANFQLAGGSFIAYCDEENGYHLYTASTDTWAAVAAGTGAGGDRRRRPGHVRPGSQLEEQAVVRGEGHGAGMVSAGQRLRRDGGARSASAASSRRAVRWRRSPTGPGTAAAEPTTSW